jgi:hypothetical protein
LAKNLGTFGQLALRVLMLSALDARKLMLVRVLLNFRMEWQVLPTVQVRGCAQTWQATHFSKAVVVGGIQNGVLMAAERSLSFVQ